MRQIAGFIVFYLTLMAFVFAIPPVYYVFNLWFSWWVR